MKIFTCRQRNVIIISILVLSVFLSACIRQKTGATETGEEHEMYDGALLAAEFEFERTKDPATGTVPKERLLAAIQQTIDSKGAYSSAIGGLSWIERGPTSDIPGPSNGNTRANGAITSGRMRAIMVDSTDPTYKTVWVAGVDGGLWKTTNITASPASWAVINDNLNNLAISDICQDPRPGSQNIMYFCTGESYCNADRVRGTGVFKSTDFGQNWTYLASTSAFVNCTRVLCDYLGNVYLGTVGTGLRRSLDGGSTWADITPSGVAADICDLEITSTAEAGRLHVVSGISTAQAYRYTDIPATVAAAAGWTPPAAAFPSFTNRAEICVSGTTLYALPANASQQVPTIYKSTNGGANWAATTGQPTAGWANGQACYDLSCAIDPSSSGATCIIGGLDTWKTTNGGASWTKISSWVGTSGQYVHADQHELQWFDNGNKLLFGCDGGIHYSTDKGVTIRDRNVGLRIKQFYSVAIHPTNTNYFLAGAQDNGTHQFNNAGLSNTVEVTGGDGAFVAIDQDAPLFQYASYIFNEYFRSTNGGATWTNIILNNATGRFINPFDYDNSTDIMYSADVASSYRRWTDTHTGSTSAVVNISNLSGNVTAVTISPTANKVFFGTSTGRVVQVDGANTIASGSAGTDRSTGLPGGTVSCINFGTDDQNLIICESNYGINNLWVSTNGGANWTAIDGNLPDMPVRWCMFYPGSNTRAYIATETGVWETDLINGASTIWNANPSFPTVRTDMIKYRDIDRSMAAATHGRGLWTATIPTIATPDLSFQYATAATSESTTFSSACRGYTDYRYYMTIANTPTSTGTVTLAIAGGGTATQGVDYIVTTNGNFTTPGTTLTFAGGAGTPQPFTIRVFDDDADEAAENFTINYAVTGGNAQAGATNQTMVFTINDNDAAPILATSASGTIGTYNTNLQATFAGGNFDERNQIIYTAAELAALGFTSAGNITSIGLNVSAKNSTQPFNGFTIRLKNTASTSAGGGFATGGTQVYNSNYTTVVGPNTFAITPFFWDGTSNLLVEFCYDNSTATVTDNIQAQNGGVTYTDFKSTNATPGCSLTGLGTYAARPVITLGWSSVFTPVSTALNSTKSAYLGPLDDVYYFDGSGNIIARIKNLTTFDYGCTEIVIDRAGSSSAQFWNTAPANYLLAKTCKVTPANINPAGSYQITLYYTAAEVAGWEAATGRTWASSAMQVVKVGNGFFVPDVTPAVPHIADVSLVTGTKSTLGSDFTIRGDFSSTGFSGFGVGVPGNALSVADFITKATGNFTNGAIWQFNNEGAGFVDALQPPTSTNNVTIQPGHTVTLNTAFVLNAGKTFTVIGTLDAGTNTISGAGAFSLPGGGSFASSNTGTNGISQNITVSGTKTFTDAANYIFNGATTAPFGSLFTTVTPNNVTIGANVSLDKPTFITGILGFSGSSRTLTTASNLTLVSSSTATARVANLTRDFFTAAVISGNSISGMATVERYINSNVVGRKWHLLSGISTVTAQTLRQSWQENGVVAAGLGTWITSNTFNGSNGYDATNNNLSSIFTHNPAFPAWVTPPATNSGSINASQGYMIFVRGDRTATALNALNASTILRTTGTLRQGTQTGVTILNSNPATAYTLIGNPYASPIDFETIASATNLSPFFTVWDPTLAGSFGVGGFRTVERTGPGVYVATPNSANNNSLRYLHSGQAFFVKTNGAGNASVAFNENSKTSSLSVVNPIVPGINDQQLYTSLMVMGNGNTENLADAVRVRFNDSYVAATTDDAPKIGNFTENISSYRNGKKLIVELRPMISKNDTIFLQLSNTGIKDYRLKIDAIDFVQTGVTAYLEDTWLKSFTRLDLTGSVDYNFSVTSEAASANPDRFRIVFNAATPVPSTSILVKAVEYGNDVRVNWTVSNQQLVQKYEVEHSTDGVRFTKVNSQAATGILGSNVNYNWLHMNPVPGDNFYRIKSIGIGGNEKMSDVVLVSLGKNNPAITVVPNPVINRTIGLQFNRIPKGLYQVRIFNSMGQAALLKTINHAGGTMLQTFMMNAGIAKGNYRLEILKPDGTKMSWAIVVAE